MFSGVSENVLHEIDFRRAFAPPLEAPPHNLSNPMVLEPLELPQPPACLTTERIHQYSNPPIHIHYCNRLGMGHFTQWGQYLISPSCPCSAASLPNPTSSAGTAPTFAVLQPDFGKSKQNPKVVYVIHHPKTLVSRDLPPKTVIFMALRKR